MPPVGVPLCPVEVPSVGVPPGGVPPVGVLPVGVSRVGVSSVGVPPVGMPRVGAVVPLVGLELVCYVLLRLGSRNLNLKIKFNIMFI